MHNEAFWWTSVDYRVAMSRCLPKAYDIKVCICMHKLSRCCVSLHALLHSCPHTVDGGSSTYQEGPDNKQVLHAALRAGTIDVQYATHSP